MTSESHPTPSRETAEIAGQWQPIETAPKDGTSILLYTSEGIIEGYWSHNDWEQSPCHATYDGCGGVAINCRPTHWMPLPAPPTIACATGGQQ
ncbi:DUF551 domain-containing protein [Variovorax sp. YR634]|uniref:DUF551 domain-containing protein n=1 Tax=Variovorax sp. YR634 TaxID=1884385 RepID=UPI0015A12DA9